MPSARDHLRRLQLKAMYASAKRAFPDIRDIGVEELKALLAEEDVVLVDVRTPAEQEVSMIPGAITSEEFLRNSENYRKKQAVAYCTMGGRSGHFTREMQQQGFNIANFRGAILAWTHGGGDLEDADGPTRRVHVHSRQCRLEADGYEPVW